MAKLSLDKIVDEAITMADEFGLEQITINKLAKRLNVKPPSLYNYIASLAELRRHISLRGIIVLTNYVQKAAIAKTKAEAIIAISLAYREFALQNPSLFWASLATVEDKDQELYAAGHELLEILLAVLRSFGFKEAQLIHQLRVYRAMITGFIVLEQNQAFGMPEPLDESFAALLKVFINSCQNLKDT